MFLLIVRTQIDDKQVSLLVKWVEYFRDLLDAMGLVQHVKQPTNIHGHTLDLVIIRQSDDSVAE